MKIITSQWSEDVKNDPNLYPHYQYGYAKSAIKSVLKSLQTLNQQIDTYSRQGYLDMLLPVMKSHLANCISELEMATNAFNQKPEKKNEMDLSAQ